MTEFCAGLLLVLDAPLLSVGEPEDPEEGDVVPLPLPLPPVVSEPEPEPEPELDPEPEPDA